MPGPEPRGTALRAKRASPSAGPRLWRRDGIVKGALVQASEALALARVAAPRIEPAGLGIGVEIARAEPADVHEGGKRALDASPSLTRPARSGRTPRRSRSRGHAPGPQSTRPARRARKIVLAARESKDLPPHFDGQALSPYGRRYREVSEVDCEPTMSTLDGRWCAAACGGAGSKEARGPPSET